MPPASPTLPVLPHDVLRIIWQRTWRVRAAALIVRAVRNAMLKRKASVLRYVLRYVSKSRGSAEAEVEDV